MDQFSMLWQGFEAALTAPNLLFLFMGVFLGQVVGALPGIGPAAGMALLLPITYGIEPVSAVVMLAGIMYGGMYGGTLTSVLINVPGEAASVMTAVDGHQLAKQGKAGTVLTVAAVGSFFAGMTGTLALVFAVVGLSQLALSFGAPEYFLLTVLGITATANLGSSTMVKALIVAAFGLGIALVGSDPVTGVSRMTFGSVDLLEGIDFLPVAIGIFGLAEVLSSLENSHDLRPLKTRLRDMWPTLQDWVYCRAAILRGTVIGFIVGVMPGAGPTLAALLAYIAERRFSRNPERFGKGALDGVASSESANNSAVSGALVPMLALGIPGSAGTAVLLAALTIQGIRPGPMLMSEHPQLVWGLIASMFIGNIFLLIMNVPLAPLFAMMLRVPYAYLAAGILVLSLVGAYATTMLISTVVITLVFGIIGYLMLKAGLPRAPLVLAMVLAPLMESSLRQSLMLSEGSLGIFIQRPVAAVLLVVVLLNFAWPLLRFTIGALRRRSEPRAAEH